MSNTSCIDVPFFLFDYISFIPDLFMNFFVVSVFYGTHCRSVVKRTRARNSSNFLQTCPSLYLSILKPTVHLACSTHFCVSQSAIMRKKRNVLTCFRRFFNYHILWFAYHIRFAHGAGPRTKNQKNYAKKKLGRLCQDTDG